MQTVIGGAHIGVALLPADAHGVADHHIKGQVIIELHLGIGSQSVRTQAGCRAGVIGRRVSIALLSLICE